MTRVSSNMLQLLLLASGAIRTSEAFGSYLDQLQQVQKSSSSTATKATATLAPPSTARPIATPASSTGTSDLTDFWSMYENLGPLDDDEILKNPYDKTKRTAAKMDPRKYSLDARDISSSSTSRVQRPQLESRATATDASPAGDSFTGMTGSSRFSESSATARNRPKETGFKSSNAAAASIGSAGDYFSSMSSSGTSGSSAAATATPKKSYGPASGGTKYKAVADSGFNGFLSGLSTATPQEKHQTHEPTTFAGVKQQAEPTQSTRPSTETPSRSQAASKSESEAKSRTKFSSASSSSAPRQSFESLQQNLSRSIASKSNSPQPVSKPIDDYGVSRLSEGDATYQALSKNSNGEKKSSLADGNSIKFNSVKDIPVSSATSFPARPVPFQSKRLDTQYKAPTTSTRVSSVNKFPAPPIPMPYKAPEKSELAVKAVKYSRQAPVTGMFPAPPMPLPYIETDDGDIAIEPIIEATRLVKPTKPAPMARTMPGDTRAPPRNDVRTMSSAPLQRTKQSSYYGGGGAPELSDSAGIRYIPRTEVFGNIPMREDQRSDVIASSSSGDYDVTISTNDHNMAREMEASRQTTQRRRFEDRFNSLLQGNADRAKRAHEASVRRSQAIETLAKNYHERKQVRPLLEREVTRAHKAPAALISDMTEASPVQGGSLKTWSFKNHAIERIHVALKTGGRPLNAELNLWRGPDDVPFKMRVYCENGHERPFSAVFETPIGPNTVSVRNSGLLEFPLAANIVAEEDERVATALPSAASSNFETGAKTVHGGALKTYAFDASVESVQVLLRTDGLPINATIELMQGPTNSKQSVHVYSEDGSARPLYMVIETPGNGNVVRVVNAGPVEFPLIASIEPYSIGQTLSPTEPIISGDVIHDNKDPDDTSQGLVRRLCNFGRNRWNGKS
ncbi:hypothetical protein MPSEU_001056900 [Mayamaea pseudoterrestris]|nr:hypothetical protein MPSEU_001056900 [Mayamaea pseudoterrestris]